MTNEEMQHEIEQMLAAARAEAQAIIDAAKAEAAKVTTRKPKAAKVVKVKVELTPEEQEAANALAAEKQARADTVKARLEELQTEIAELKAELKTLTGKVGTGNTQRGPVGVGAFIKDLIQEGLDNDAILARVAAEWPDNFTNASCVNWYRNALKNWPNGVRPSRKIITVDGDNTTVEEEVEEEDEETTETE
jgi:hypothetical protein